MWPHRGRVEREDRFPRPAGRALFNASWDTIDLLGHRATTGSWPTCCPPEHPGPSLQSSFPQSITCTGACGYLSSAVGLHTCIWWTSSDKVRSQKQLPWRNAIPQPILIWYTGKKNTVIRGRMPSVNNLTNNFLHKK